MEKVLYDKPIRMEMKGNELLVNGNAHPMTVRTVNQMASTFMGRVDPAELENFEMYYMYRNIHSARGIRFDITVIPWKPVGGECPKTHGHYHPKSEDGLAYPEVYQVLKGRAIFIMQKKNRNGSVDVSIVSAEEKDVVVLPPGYGHVSINPGPQELVLANISFDRFSSIYHDYDTNRGAAYYYLKDGELVQNTNYIVERNERMTAKELNARYKFSCSDLLAEFYASPEKFSFLEKPSLLFKA